jgi:DNA repair exonuclease SbcCD ATPase subunit
LAILVALLDVQLVGGQFQGLDHLVSGLSGKFLSSIVALGASTLFLFAERPLWHRLTQGIGELVATVDHLVPCLPSTRLLADVHRDIEVQAAAFQHFNADFSTRLQQGIREGLAPSLERISVTLQELSHLLRAAEARQQETITGTLDGLLAGHTAVLQELTAQMREVAGMSVTQIGSALTAVVYDLSTKVTELGQQMTQTATESAGQTASAAHAVLERADAWSARNAEQLAQLLERHRGQLERSHDVQAAFDTTLARFAEALAQYTTITGHLRQVASQVRTMVTAAAGASETIRDATTSLDRAAGLAALQAERFAEAAQRQEEVQRQMVESLRQYQQVFSQVNTTASDLLTQMGQHLRQYTDTTRQGFASLLQAVDEHFANASRHLGDTVHGLDAHLQDLSASLKRFRGDRGTDGG